MWQLFWSCSKKATYLTFSVPLALFFCPFWFWELSQQKLCVAYKKCTFLRLLQEWTKIAKTKVHTKFSSLTQSQDSNQCKNRYNYCWTKSCLLLFLNKILSFPPFKIRVPPLRVFLSPSLKYLRKTNVTSYYPVSLIWRRYMYSYL